MAENTASMDGKGIEERLLDYVSDAIGGEGSVVVISGGSGPERHSIMAHVLDEAEVMGCLVRTCDCADPGADGQPLIEALSTLTNNVGGSIRLVPVMSDGAATLGDRSYRAEMAGLDVLLSAARENPILLAIERIEAADLATISIFSFLARNIEEANVLMIVATRSPDEDPLLVQKLASLKREVLVHDLHLHGGGAEPKEDEPPVRHGVVVRTEDEASCISSAIVQQIIVLIASSQNSLASGNTSASVSDARSALVSSASISHHGLVLDANIALGAALMQTGREGEALEAFDRAIRLSIILGEPLSQYFARIKRAELLLFSIGESDSACQEAAAAEEISRQWLEIGTRIEPLTMKALIEARNGRREHAEKAFREASGILENEPVDMFILERMLLAMAAATLLETRFDLGGMNVRYDEAAVLATGTDFPEYWGAIVSFQRAHALLRSSRPREAKAYLDEACMRFGRLCNEVQSSRAKRAAEGNDVGIMLE